MAADVIVFLIVLAVIALGVRIAMGGQAKKIDDDDVGHAFDPKYDHHYDPTVKYHDDVREEEERKKHSELTL